MLRWCRAALLLAVVILSAPLSAEEQYLLDSEDVLQVVVLNHPELSVDSLTVLADGSIDYPIVGHVMARGLTPAQLERTITEGMKKELRNPKVTVIVKVPRQRRIYVSGGVGQAGIVDWKEGWRLSEAIAAAGGLKIMPELAVATVLRVGQDPIVINLDKVYVEADPKANIPVLPGDSISIHSRTHRIYVTGQVNAPGGYDLPIGKGVREAVALAGGLKDTAAPTRAYVQRGGTKIGVDLHRLLELGDESQNLALQEGDNLHVPEGRDHVAILGHVNRPGFYPLVETERLTVAQLVARAGGGDRDAKLHEVTLQRAKGGAITTMVVDVRAIVERGELQRDVVLEPSDIVLVPGRRRRTPRNVLADLYGLGVLRSLLTGF